MNYRTHTCLACKHQWTSAVAMSPHSPATSGERTEQCPDCNAKGIMSSPWHTDIAPASSPWGHVQHAKRLAPGIWRVSTASHGGIWLSEERLAKLQEIVDYPTFCGAAQWFEEDCDWCIPFVAFGYELECESYVAACRQLRAMQSMGDKYKSAVSALVKAGKMLDIEKIEQAVQA